eukprot:4583489-Prymnesium_polylepis.1
MARAPARSYFSPLPATRPAGRQVCRHVLHQGLRDRPQVPGVDRGAVGRRRRPDGVARPLRGHPRDLRLPD